MLYSPFSDAMVDWLSRDRVTAVIAASIQFESGTVYVHSGTVTTRPWSSWTITATT